MPSQRAPWSRSPGRSAMPVAWVGGMDPALIRAATGRRVAAPPPGTADAAGAGEPPGGTEPGGDDADGTVSAHLLGAAVPAIPGLPVAEPATLPAGPEPVRAQPRSARVPAGHPDIDHSPPARVRDYAAAGHSGAVEASAARPGEVPAAENSGAPDPGVARHAGSPRAEHPPTHELSRTPAFGGHALLGLCLGLAVLLVAGGFFLGRTTGPDEAGGPGLVTVASAPTATVQAVPAPSKSTAPEPGSRDVGTGFVFGKVQGNDGETLTIKSEITPTEVTVHTDRGTKLYVLMASRVEGISVGAPVMVYGRRHADGSITADTITGLSLQT